MNARRMAHLAWLVLGMLGLALGSGGCAQERDERALRADQIATQEGLARVAGEVLDDPDRLQRMERLSGLLELLPGDRYGELSALIESRAVIPRQEDIGLIMHAWARRDPKAAFAQGLDWKLREMPWTEPIPDHAVSEVIYAWSQDAGADVEAAIADVPQDLQPLLKVAMIRGWTESGQEMRATNAIANEQSGFGQLLVTVLVEWLIQHQGTEAAIRWAETVPQEQLRTHAFARTAGVVARVDPKRAIEWTLANLGKPDTSGMTRMVATEWAKREPPVRVLEWIDTVPDEGERRDAATWVFQNWHRRDSTAAMQWLQARSPLEIMYRPVLSMHVRTLLQQDPNQAIAWAGGIADPERRRDTQVVLAQAWLAQDPEAAQEWIEEAGLEQPVADAIARRKAMQVQHPQRPRRPAAAAAPGAKPAGPPPG